MNEVKKLKKLVLNKEVVTKLYQNEMFKIKGGTDSTDMPPWTGTVGFTVGACDLPTIGHDDGPNCLSKSDFLCWCYGI